MNRPPPACTLFPYTTLFRSHQVKARDRRVRDRPEAADRDALFDVGLPVEDERDPFALQHYLKVGGITLILDRKSTRLNSSHGSISYAVFCLKKKKQTTTEGE